MSLTRHMHTPSLVMVVEAVVLSGLPRTKLARTRDERCGRVSLAVPITSCTSHRMLTRSTRVIIVTADETVSVHRIYSVDPSFNLPPFSSMCYIDEKTTGNVVTTAGHHHWPAVPSLEGDPAFDALSRFGE